MSSKLALLSYLKLPQATSSYLALVAFALVFVFSSCDDPVSDKKLPQKNESSAITVAALRDMLVGFRTQLVASGLMEEQDVNELETLNGLDLMNKLVSTGILEETDVTPLNGSGKKASSTKGSVAKGSRAKGSSAKESGAAKGSSAKASRAEGSGAEESSFAITLTKLKDILVKHDIIEEDDVAGLDDSGLKEKLIEEKILEEADVITLRKPESTNEPISLDFLEELKKFVEKAFASSISDGKSSTIFDDEDGKEIYDYVIGERDVTPESQAHLAVRRRIFNDAENTIKNFYYYIEKIDHKLANSPKYQILATDENFIGLKDLVDKVYSDILKSETQDQEGPTYPDDVFEPYKYSDPLIEYNLSQEENEDKAVEILLKATAGAGFELLDELLELAEDDKSLIKDHLYYMTQDEKNKANELAAKVPRRIKAYGQDILKSLPEEWKDEFRGKYDVIKKKFVSKGILKEDDAITLRKPESISLDFLEELKKFVEKVSAYSISDGKSRSIFDDKDGKQVTDYVIGKSKRDTTTTLYGEDGTQYSFDGDMREYTAEFEKYYSKTEAIDDSASKSLKNLHAYLQEIEERSDKSSTYYNLAENKDFIVLKDVVDKEYSHTIKEEQEREKYRQEMEKQDKDLKISHLDEVYEKYVYADPLVGHDLSNEDKAVEIFLKATCGTFFEILDELLELTEAQKSLISDHLSYNLMTFKLKKMKKESDPITIACKKGEECKPAIKIEVDGEFKRKTYEEDEIDGEPEIKPYMTEYEKDKAKKLAAEVLRRIKSMGQDILKSLPEEWKNEFRDKYDVI